MGPDFFSKSARAFLKGVGVRGASVLGKSHLFGVVMFSDDVVGSCFMDKPLGVFSGL